MTSSARISYAFIALLFVLVGWLHLATPLLAVLFSYFALTKLTFGGKKLLAIVLYSLVLLGVAAGFYYFTKRAYVALPKIASTTIPVVLEYAEKRGLELPFSDYASLKVVALESIGEKLANVGKYARSALIEIAG